MKTKINTIFRSIQSFGELCQWTPAQQDFWYQYLDDFSTRVDNHGLAEAVKGNKAVRLAFTKAVTGDPSSPKEVSVSKKSKIPKVLTPLREILDSREGQRQVLTVLTFTRALEPTRIDESGLQKITAPGVCKPEVVDLMTSHLDSFLRSLNSTGHHSPKGMGQWIATSKSGPNGHAMKSMYKDLISLSDSHVSDLTVLGGDSLGKALVQNKNIGPHLDGWQKFTLLFKIDEGIGKFGKLQMIPDSEMKTRFIALGNYGVQNALKPLHDYQFTLLGRLRSDCTYNQAKAKDVLAQNPGHHFWSIDLSNATERFPREVQRIFVSSLCSPEYAASWDRIIAAPLSFKGREVAFEAGQPIGYYSSWSTFSLCHHWVVHTACKMAGVHPKGNYVLLGDDIVISHDTVAQHYRYLVQGLGVELNMNKTHVSPSHFEFAKRGIAHGEGEGSPFPIKAVINAAHSSDILHALYTGHEKGGFSNECPIKMVGVLIAGLFENYSEGFRQHTERIATILHHTMQASIKKQSGAETFRILSGTFGLEIFPPSDIDRVVEVIFGSDILRQGLKRSFASKGIVDGGALGGGIPKETINDTLSQESCVPATPHASISREVVKYFTNELKFIDISETLRGIMTKNGRSVLIKDLSTMFTERNQKMDGVSCMKFGKYLVSILKQVAKCEKAMHPDPSLGVRIILKRHLDDWGVCSLIDHNYPEFSDLLRRDMKDFYEKDQGEPLEQEDFEGLLEQGFGYSEDKGQIKGMQFKKGSTPMNYTFHIAALAQKRDQSLERRA